ncbi:MAG: UDP-N-acetylmuramate--alanine ligase [bacterium]|nr:UDP-N-acetylmuramate--alanine ligase [bacterium]
MSALAFILHEMGVQVSGSDVGESPFLDALSKRGVRIFNRHEPSNIGDAKYIVFSSAIKEDNPELLFAIKQGLRIMHRAELLEIIMDSFKRIGITGTHGKTTTTAMVMKVLIDMGLDPSGVIGGDYPYIGGNYRLGKGGYFVAEIDESDGSFLHLSRLDYLIITNLEEEHIENYRGFDELKVKIAKLAEASQVVLFNSDDPVLISMKLKGLSYGFKSGSFRGMKKGPRSLYVEGFGTVNLSVTGEHNLYNALAVMALAKELGLDKEGVVNSLKEFRGVRRRMEVLGEAGGILFIDDYAHHPTEIKAVLETLRKEWRDRRLVVVFQPHRYSRTLRMYRDIARALMLADFVAVTEIYSASEIPIPGVSGKLIYDVLQEAGKQNSVFFSDMQNVQEFFLRELKKGDLFITMGAGDIYKLGRTLLVKIKEGCQ